LIDEIQGAGDLGTDFKGAVLTFICFYAMSYKKMCEIKIITIN